MATSLSEMTKKELVRLIETVIDRKLVEVFDTYEDVELKPEVRERLIRQRELVAQGERGVAFEDIVEQFDLD